MAVRSLGELTLDLVARTGGFTGPLDKAARHSRGRMQEIERSGRAAAAGISALSAAGAAAGAGILAYTNKAASSVRELKSQAQVANASTQEIQRLAYASQTVGVEQEKLSDIFKDVNDRVGQFLNEGNGEMALFFEKIAPQVGVTADEFARLSGPEALQLYYNSLEKAGLSQQQMTAYMEAMSDESTALIPLLKDGGAGFSDLADEADRLGIVLSDAQANALTDFAAQFDRVTGIMSAAGHVAAAELSPALSDLADELVEIAVAFQDGEYDRQIELLTNVGTVATGAAGAYAAYRSAIAAATLAQWAFNTAASANPVGALVTVLGAAAGALFTFRDELGLTSSAAERAANRVDELTNAIDLSSEAAIKAQLVNLTGQTLALEQQATEARDALKGLGDASIDPGPFRQSMVLGADAGERREHYEALREAEEGLDANRAAADKLREQLKLLQESGVEPVDRSFKVFTEGTSEAAKAAEEAANQLSALMDELYPLEALQRQYLESQQILTAAYDEGVISLERYRDAMERLKEAQRNDEDPSQVYDILAPSSMGMQSEEGDYWARWLEGAREAFTSFDELAGSTINNFSESFGNAFESMIFDAENLGDAVYDMAEGMARSVVSALGEMAAQWLAYQAVQMLVDETGQEAAGKEMATNAAATSLQAGIAAYASTAAIPIVGPALAPAAMQTALTATAPIAAGISAMGMAHDGIDSVPQDGTWLLQKGERVTTADTSAKLDRTLDDVRRNSGGGGGDGTEVHVHNAPSGTRVAQRQVNGKEIIDVMIDDAMGAGRYISTVEQTHGLRRRGIK